MRIAGSHCLPEETCCGKRPQDAAHVVWLQILTLLWMGIECSVAILSAWRAHSSALLAFGFDSFVELMSAGIVLLQFGRRLNLDSRRAARMAGVLLFVLAAVVTIDSVGAIALHVRPGTSWLGLMITGTALLIMPGLAFAKRRAARRIQNRALLADAVQSATCAYLALITMCGLTINALFHISWVDPAAALAAVPIICIEGKRALSGENSCC
jgi:divalent metal cation (Fe/Co/Zn/Cd) transporter